MSRYSERVAGDLVPGARAPVRLLALTSARWRHLAPGRPDHALRDSGGRRDGDHPGDAATVGGKGHSPLCRHAHEREVVAGDDLLTVADLMARTDSDWCSKCGGYAMRRLSDSQLSYHRAARQLHNIKRRLDGETGLPGTDTSTVTVRLAELVAWQPAEDAEWLVSDSRQWQDTIRELRRRVARAHAVTGPGELAS